MLPASTRRLRARRSNGDEAKSPDREDQKPPAAGECTHRARRCLCTRAPLFPGLAPDPAPAPGTTLLVTSSLEFPFFASYHDGRLSDDEGDFEDLGQTVALVNPGRRSDDCGRHGLGVKQG